MNRDRLNWLVTFAATILSVLAVSVAITVGPEGEIEVRVEPAPEQGVAITIGTKASPNEPVIIADVDNQVDLAELEDAAAPSAAAEGPGIHEDARDEIPPGAPDNAPALVLDSSTAGIGPKLPAVGAENYSCPRNFVRNYSDRAPGARVLSFKLHVAVARAGALSVIRRLFDTPSFGASSHLGLDQNGRCEQWVPFEKKAWTQGAFNSTSESIEIMAMGTETRTRWLAMPIFQKGILASIVADRLRARGLPPRLVDPAGCTDVAGYTDHERLECGNTHVDVGNGFPWDVFGRQLRRAYYGGDVVLPDCTVKNVKRRLNAHKAGHHWRSPPSPALVVDSIYGPRARRNVVRFQRAHALEADGVVGASTGTALRLRGCGNAQIGAA